MLHLHAPFLNSFSKKDLKKCQNNGQRKMAKNSRTYYNLGRWSSPMHTRRLESKQIKLLITQ